MKRSNTYRSTNVGWLPVLGIQAGSAAVTAEVTKIAELAGVDLKSTPEAVLNLTEIRASVPRVRASFHPAFSAYFAEGSVDLTLPDEAEDLLELILAAGTTRRGRVVGVVGAFGGAGATTAAVWLARTWAESGEDVALVDADPVSSGIDRLLALHESPGVRWADIKPDAGALVPGRLFRSLPAWGRLRVLSADARGAVPSDDAGQAAVAALSQVCSPCVVDVGPQALAEGGLGRRILDWVDVLAVVTGPGKRGEDAARLALSRVPPGVDVHVIASGASGGEAAALTGVLDVDRVWPLRRVRGLDKDVDHGVRVGDRRRSVTARDIRSLAAVIA